MPWDFALYLYRSNQGLTWSDVSGEWPQPRWRLDQDFWYEEIAAEVAAAKRR